MSFVWLKMDGSIEEVDAGKVERLCSQGYIVKSWKEMFEGVATTNNTRIAVLESQKSELLAALAELVGVVAMTEDNRKMPHQHADKELRLNCLAERAREALTKHKEILKRYGVNK